MVIGRYIYIYIYRVTIVTITYNPKQGTYNLTY